ncbi:MAG: serine/threonine-protein kinase [Cyanobacteriota bacterium]|nr:serine/threonine-protein kinase [Cyanobacteriota bacterium]
MLQAGDILRDRYQLQEQLGTNLIRSTWLVRDLAATESELAVVKLLALGGHVHWEHLKLFEREAQVLQNLDHPHIPKYRDYFSIDENCLWFALVEDYIPGSSLKQLLDRGKIFAESEIRQIATELLQILTYLHQLTPLVLHRDLKPSNIIYGEDKKVYLVDFGSVQHQAAAPEGATFTIVGTYGYTPMEQFSGRAVPQSDLYALGATLIHLVTGTSPANLPQKEFRIQFRDSATISPTFADWLEELTEPQVDRRFPNANEALDALKFGKITSTRASSKPVRASTSSNPNSSGRGLFDTSTEVPQEIKGWNWGAFLFPTPWSITNNVWITFLPWLPSLIVIWNHLAGSTINSVNWLSPAIYLLTFLVFPFLSLLLQAVGIFSYPISWFVIQIFVSTILGVKGNEWAWKSRQWRGIVTFKRHQSSWVTIILFIMASSASFSIFASLFSLVMTVLDLL